MHKILEEIQDYSLTELCILPNIPIHTYFMNYPDLVVIDCSLNFHLAGFSVLFIHKVKDLLKFLKKVKHKTIVIDYLNFYFDQVNNPLLLFNALWDCIYNNNRIFVINHFKKINTMNKATLESKHSTLYNKMCSYKVTITDKIETYKNKENTLIK